ncbi:hypothetical protein J2X54_000201 [Duganella sp. 3397]|uniref:hypothetical protein n=1 Tax=Duganella sp. 3397 TaxID=2817732 RepID=UPI002861E47D|nr:hypothetical protein [Duganella sp. 3397]MDR7047766.1 hypothetical protein [Duganella sp. 3397]
MSINSQNFHLFGLARPAFSQRFIKLQSDLKATLAHSHSRPAHAVLDIQDRLILRLEGWIDSVEDSNMLAKTDIVLLRQTLAANRNVYRLKALAAHRVEISDAEQRALNEELNSTMNQILANALPNTGMGASPDARGLPIPASKQSPRH